MKAIKNKGVYSAKFECALTARANFSLLLSPIAMPDFLLVIAALTERPK
jgi:hypothetical protein